MQLLANPSNVVRMGMANGDYGMASVQVKILLTLIVPKINATGFLRSDIHKGIDVKQLHIIYVWGQAGATVR